MYENMKVTIQNHEADVCAGVMGVCSEVVYISLKLLKQPAVFWEGKKRVKEREIKRKMLYCESMLNKKSKREKESESYKKFK